ncbi:unnamed protein product [Ranitomeya imitator]|uniref:Coiled-coil domain-containing protein 80 n=1 Tax=Ranitomeya imitator TaxID=111125 RepID=A0ABN9LKW1_9NEOB|nr:unnamed protein product [Ranitomeya imitator]
MQRDESQTHVKRVNTQQRAGVRQPQARMLKDDSATSARSRTARFPSTASSPNILASFAGKNRVWIISSPHASDGYYRLMMSLLKNDVYCELAERHIQQIVIFHEEGEEGGKIRRITNEGKILEQPIDPAIVPKMMTSLKLEKGKFGMVLLKKTLQIEERYPYPVRLEAMYEVIDQSPIRKIEKLRQKGFVQKCKAAGVEGQVSEEGERGGSSSTTSGTKPTPASETIQITVKKEEPKRNVIPTRSTRVKSTRKPYTAPSTPSTTVKITTIAPSTNATTRILTTASRAPTTVPTTVLPTTQKPWSTKSMTTSESHRLPVQAEVTTRDPETARPYFPVRTDKHRDRQHVQTGKHFATTSKTNKPVVHESHTVAPVVSTTTAEHYTKENTGRFGDNRTDRQGQSSQDVTSTQKKPQKTKSSKKKGVEKIFTNEYDDKFNPGKTTTSQVEETIEEVNIPPKKEKDQKKGEKPEKIDKKKKKADKLEKPPKKDKTSKKDKSDKKVKAEKDRNKKNKKAGKGDEESYIKAVKKTVTEAPKKSLTTFLHNFEGKRRLLVAWESEVCSRASVNPDEEMICTDAQNLCESDPSPDEVGSEHNVDPCSQTVTPVGGDNEEDDDETEIPDWNENLTFRSGQEQVGSEDDRCENTQDDDNEVVDPTYCQPPVCQSMRSAEEVEEDASDESDDEVTVRLPGQTRSTGSTSTTASSTPTVPQTRKSWWLFRLHGL